MPPPLEIFLSHAQADKALRDEAAVHLMPLVRKGWIREDGSGKHADRVASADIILLLISSDYLGPDCSRELNQALAKDADREAIAVPVLLRPCDWKRGPLAHLRSLPRGERPVTLWSNREAAWQDVVIGVRWVISRCHILVADTWAARERDLAALESLETARTITEQLMDDEPKRAEWQTHLAAIHDKIGDGLIRYGEGLGALASFQTAHTIRSRLVDEHPDNTQFQRALSTSYDNIGDVLRALGEKSAALAAFQSSLSIRAKLAASKDYPPNGHQELYMSHSKVGNVLRALGDTQGAIAAFRTAIDMARRLAENDNGNPQWRVDDALFCFKIATILAEGTAGERAEARTLLEHARRTLSALSEASLLPHRQAIWLPAVEDFLMTLEA